MPELIIIGGGVIGLSTALELASRGVEVTLLDRQATGREASWAGAGILPPGHAGKPEDPRVELCCATNRLWPDLSEQLRDETGIDNGFARCGGIAFSPDGDAPSLEQEMADWHAIGVSAQRLSPEELHDMEPGLGSTVGPAYSLPDECQVRNPRHLKALLSSCVRRGVDVRTGTPAIGFERRGERLESVLTAEGRLKAPRFLVTAGAWSGLLLEPVAAHRRVEPVRGQIALLSLPVPPVRHVIESGPRYLVPRADGRTLVGSTEEWAGFEKRNTPAGLRGLMDFAIRMVPELAEARVERSWSGLRPHSVDGLPLMGKSAAAENLYVATGHFRWGLHLSPITARLMAQLITGEQPEIDLNPFQPGRTASGAAVD